MSLASKAVQRRLRPAQEVAEDDVRRLMVAALALMRGEPPRVPRVADIVAAAELSNDAFYRYFASKDDLVAAIAEDGARRLVGYVRHQMDKETDPAAQLRRGVRAVLKQAADPQIASTTRAVMDNVTNPAPGAGRGRTQLVDWLAELYADPLARLAPTDVAGRARLLAIATLGSMQYFLWHERTPPQDEVRRLLQVGLAPGAE
jgi:AcrR family transcriptional regulator